MPKTVDFPRASLKNALALAQAVDSLGGQCDPEMAASSMGKKLSGAFRSIIAAASKYGFLDHRKQRLYTTNRYREHKLAYDEEAASQILREAFLSVPVFEKVAERFSGQEVPVNILDKILMKEYGVPESVASRVASYFTDGAKQSGLIGENGIVQVDSSGDSEVDTELVYEDENEDPKEDNVNVVESREVDHSRYSVAIRGPGIQTDIAILEVEDLDIVEVMLAKIRRKLIEE